MGGGAQAATIARKQCLAQKHTHISRCNKESWYNDSIKRQLA